MQVLLETSRQDINSTDMAIVLFYDTNGVPQPVDVTDGSVHVLFKDASGNPVETDDTTWTLCTLERRIYGDGFLYDG